MGFGKDGKGIIMYDGLSQALGTLTSFDVAEVGVLNAQTMTEDFRIIKIEGFAAWEAPTSEEGPIVIGLASGELTDAEIEECLEARPVDRNDRVELEKSSRPVWPLAILGANQSNAETAVIDKTIRWTFSNDDGWKYWAYSLDGTSLTTGSYVKGLLKIFGVWVT